MKKIPEVHITLLDHTEGKPEAKGLGPCGVWGLLLEEDEDAYYVTSWCCEGEFDNHNNLVFTISKPDVISIRYLNAYRTTFPQGKKKYVKYCPEFE